MYSNVAILSFYLMYIVIIMSVKFIYSFLSIYFIYLQGRSENHCCENAPCLKIIIINRLLDSLPKLTE